VERDDAEVERPRRLLITTNERDLPTDANDDGHATVFAHDDGAVQAPAETRRRRVPEVDRRLIRPAGSRS
jgi:hypothetical protein